MRFHFEYSKREPNSMTRSCTEVPYAILFRWIIVGIVWTVDLTMRSSYFVFATAFLAVQFVIVQNVTIVTWTDVRSYSVFAFVHTSAIVDSTFVNICKCSWDFGMIITILWSVRLSSLIIPVKNTAANPLFWMVLSDRNSILIALPSDVTNGSDRDPQKTPCFLTLSSSSFE